MRKHRLYGVVIAVLLLGTTPLKRPSSPHHLSTGSDTSPSGLQLTAAELPADQTDIAASATLPALLSDDPSATPGAAVPDVTLVDAGSRTIEALWSWNDAQRAPVTPVAPTTPAPPVPTVAAPPVTAPPPVPRPVTAAARVVVSGTPGVWAALRHCESDGNYADDTGNGYYGAYQFSLGTWRGLGLSGLPSQASPAVQDQAAERLEARSGWGQWPSCSRRLRL